MEATTFVIVAEGAFILPESCDPESWKTTQVGAKCTMTEFALHFSPAYMESIPAWAGDVDEEWNHTCACGLGYGCNKNWLSLEHGRLEFGVNRFESEAEALAEIEKIKMHFPCPGVELVAKEYADTRPSRVSLQSA